MLLFDGSTMNLRGKISSIGEGNSTVGRSQFSLKECIELVQRSPARLYAPNLSGPDGGTPDAAVLLAGAAEAKLVAVEA